MPSFDVEGQALTHQLALADWPAAGDDHALYVEDLPLPSSTVSLAAKPGEVVVVDGPDVTELLLSLSGRMRITGGRVKVAGFVLPEQAAAVRRRTGYLDLAQISNLRRELQAIRRARAKVIFVDHADLAPPELLSLLDDQPGPAVVIGVGDRALFDRRRPAARYELVDSTRP